AHSFFERLRNAVQERDRNVASDVSAGDARAHDAGAQNADPLHGFWLDGRIGHTRILLQSLRHEEHRDQIARNRSADHRRKSFRLDSKSVVQREVAALLDRAESRERGWKLTFGLGYHL